MISFVWSAGLRLPAGTGGSENYTIGHVRELNRRGVNARIVTIGLGTADGREEFPGIPFLALRNIAEVGELDGTVVFVAAFRAVNTKNPSYQMLHIPPPLRARERSATLEQLHDRGLIATSQFAARLWSDYLDVDVATVQVVYPFAEPGFGLQPRLNNKRGTVRVLYAGRLSPEKGIYTFLAMLHNDLISDLERNGTQITFTVTTAGADKPQGKIIHALLRAHPGIRLVPAQKSPAEMARLMTQHDIVVMPSNSQYWHETFGIVSIEAQHTGCRVVASDDGGLPETETGALILVAPDNAEALAQGIRKAVLLGEVSQISRADSATRFTVKDSVDALLNVFSRPRPSTPAEIIQQLQTISQLPPRESNHHERQITQTAVLEEVRQVAERKTGRQESETESKQHALNPGR